jgi:uncharacterized protein YndB with AHSA1/START domain
VSDQSTTHSTFVIERVYDATPTHVFHAWADADAKSQWFGPPSASGHSLDFAVGGTEQLTVEMDGDVYRYEARYQDIVPEQRIIHAYQMHRNEDRISVSLATIELAAEGEGTRLTITEQGVYLDGHDTPVEREQGTHELLDALGAALAGSVQRA